MVLASLMRRLPAVPTPAGPCRFWKPVRPAATPFAPRSPAPPPLSTSWLPLLAPLVAPRIDHLVQRRQGNLPEPRDGNLHPWQHLAAQDLRLTQVHAVVVAAHGQAVQLHPFAQGIDQPVLR